MDLKPGRDQHECETAEVKLEITFSWRFLAHLLAFLLVRARLSPKKARMAEG